MYEQLKWYTDYPAEWSQYPIIDTFRFDLRDSVGVVIGITVPYMGFKAKDFQGLLRFVAN